MAAGIEGYEKHIALFIESSQALSFHTVCRDFIEFLPAAGGRLLDVGSGAGQNAVALDELGYQVTAVEPMQEFKRSAEATYRQASVSWLAGSLPELACLGAEIERFDFVLVEGVWHHLNEVERERAVARIAELVKPAGRCALSLRNGPAGLGSCVYPTDAAQTRQQFEDVGFDCVFAKHNMDSVLPNKKDVKWSRIVMCRR